jgi:hypothetical protein
MCFSKPEIMQLRLLLNHQVLATGLSQQLRKKKKEEFNKDTVRTILLDLPGAC